LEDVTAAVGLDFVHDAGPPPTGERYFMPQIMGSGAALFDFDGDGRLDVYLVNNAGADSKSVNRLFRQGDDGRFVDVTAGSGLGVAGYGMGVSCGDFDNDGRVDLFLGEYGRVRLFRNEGGGKFDDVNDLAGLVSPLWATSSAFVDYDRDGWLDLVVVNYVDYDPARPCGTAGGEPEYCAPREFLGTVTNLYRNRGRAGAGWGGFEDVTLKSGLGKVPGPGLGVLCADFDDDGWTDLFVANDEQPNRLWLNRRDGTFADEAVLRGVAYNALGKTEANMGVAAADADGDGLFDIFVTHLTEETHTLWKQEQRGLFQDRTAAAGLASPVWRGTGFGTAFADFDNDGDPDLAVANGRIKKGPKAADAGANAGGGAGAFFARYAERNQVFVNDGRGTFVDVSAANPPFTGAAAVSRGLACGDLDNDGWPDVLVTSVAGPARVYRNVAARTAGRKGHWLTVRAVDPAAGGRDACGARITIDVDGRRRMAWVNPGYSYLCSNDPRAHFGLGDVGRVSAIEVRWPNGADETFDGAAADRLVLLQKGRGRASR
jgi:hypothetical protein